MKKIFSIVLICGGLLSSSCSDWLDLLPNNEQVTDQYWKSKEDVEAVVASGYYYMRQNITRMMQLGELRGGTLYTKGNLLWTNNAEKMQDFNLQPSHGICKYEDIYKVIGMANSVLHYAAGVRTLDDTYTEGALKAHMAEAYFMRAYCNFLLVRNWRDVPLVTEAFVTDRADYNLPVSSEEDIIDCIKSDLLTAIESGGAKTIYEEEWQTKGRATIWALYALMADVCLWDEDYDNAIIYCNKILEVPEGDTSIRPKFIADATKWFEIFYPGNSNESIFELNFNYALYQETNAFANQLSITSAQSSGFVLTERAVDKVKQEAAEVIKAQNSVVPERVGRTLMASVIYPGMVAPYSDYVRQQDLLLWKYHGTDVVDVGNFRENLDPNFIIYRVAEIVLIKAEALIMKGGPGSSEWSAAVALINQIRERAMLPAIEEQVAQEYNKLEFMQVLLNEREMEFLGEGKRWYDLLRLARKDNYNKEYYDFFVSEILEGNTTTNDLWVYNVLQDVNALYLPIPQSEIDVNPNLEQNPYYSN
ncbi:MAG: RagB/SusD family nutrient uptake outer membrane protein [Bacteroidaceae bacterium]|nr:RagB/SusD family nutrient uptake outer membrane protein [Bacteroidaceae bacterium]